MQENHSFDSELGFWCNQHRIRCAGFPAEIRLADGTTVRPAVAADKVPSVDHSVGAQRRARLNEWDKIKGCTAATGYACITGYLPNAVPNLGALAEHGVLLTNAFTLHNAPSWGGHLDEFAGTMDGFTGDVPLPKPGVRSHSGYGCDSDKVARFILPSGREVRMPACIPDFNLGLPHGGAFEPTKAKYVPTILDELDQARVTWRIYAARPGDASYMWSSCPSFADCLYTHQDSDLVQPNEFFAAAAAGQLPQVSFLMPAGKSGHTQYAVFSQHNHQSNAAGDNWIGQVASAAMQGPEGSSTALIVTYDDCGCFWDAVTPPLAPDGMKMGPRSPFVIFSPFARPEFTDPTMTSNSGSILAFIEADFGLPALGVNDANADNLMNDFNFQQRPQRLPHMVWRHLPRSAYRLSPSTARDAT